MKYFVANWKARKNLNEAYQWMEIFLSKLKTNKNLKHKLNINQLKIIICPPFPFIHPLKQKYGEVQTNLVFGAQDLSSFDEGSYTGEVTAKTLQGLVNFVILGHSERRKYFGETDKMIEKKILLAKKHGIEPILCIRDKHDLIPNQTKIIAYEPVYAIGTGSNESPEEIIQLREKLSLIEETVFLYGGSVDEKNAKKYLPYGKIDGLLIGGASLDALRFYRIITTE